MKKVQFLVDQKARDLVSVVLIGEYLKDFGVKVSYCNKSNMLATYESVKPDILVLSCTEGQYKDIACYAAPNCKIVLMPQEGACATKESTILRHTMRRMNEEVYIKGLSRVYLWNEISKRWLLEESVYPESILRVFGTSRIDPYRLRSKRRTKTNEKIRVGFANRGSSINPAVRPNPIQEIDAFRAKDGNHRAYIDDGREWEDWIWHGMASLRVNLEVIELLAESGRYEIIFRPDPFENYTSYDFLKTKYSCFKINIDPILYNFIDEIDVLVTEFSTTGTEAFLLKKPVISTQKLLGPRLPDHNSKENHLNPSHVKSYWQPKDKAEFLQILNDSAKNIAAYSPEAAQVENYLRKFYHWPTGGPSAAYLIAKDLQSLCYEQVSKEITDLHKTEYHEHPFINRLSSKIHLSRNLIKKIFLKPLLFDLIGLYRAFKNKNMISHNRTEYYCWQKFDYWRAKKIFKKLKKSDSVVEKERIN